MRILFVSPMSLKLSVRINMVAIFSRQSQSRNGQKYMVCAMEENINWIGYFMDVLVRFFVILNNFCFYDDRTLTHTVCV